MSSEYVVIVEFYFIRSCIGKCHVVNMLTDI